MTDGARQRSSTARSAKPDAANAGQESGGGGVALKKEIGLVSACGIIVGEYLSTCRDKRARGIVCDPSRAYRNVHSEGSYHFLVYEVCTFPKHALYSRACAA